MLKRKCAKLAANSFMISKICRTLSHFMYTKLLLSRGQQRNVQRFIIVQLCTTIVVLISPFVWWCSHCPCHHGFFKRSINHQEHVPSTSKLQVITGNTRHIVTALLKTFAFFAISGNGRCLHSYEISIWKWWSQRIEQKNIWDNLLWSTNSKLCLY